MSDEWRSNIWTSGRWCWAESRAPDSCWKLIRGKERRGEEQQHVQSAEEEEALVGQSARVRRVVGRRGGVRLCGRAARRSWTWPLPLPRTHGPRRARVSRWLVAVLRGRVAGGERHAREWPHQPRHARRDPPLQRTHPHKDRQTRYIIDSLTRVNSTQSFLANSFQEKVLKACSKSRYKSKSLQVAWWRNGLICMVIEHSWLFAQVKTCCKKKKYFL